MSLNLFRKRLAKIMFLSVCHVTCNAQLNNNPRPSNWRFRKISHWKKKNKKKTSKQNKRYTGKSALFQFIALLGLLHDSVFKTLGSG